MTEWIKNIKYLGQTDGYSRDDTNIIVIKGVCGCMIKRRDYDLAHIDSDRYRELKYCCYQYNRWKKEIEEIDNNLNPSGMTYDGMPHGSNVSSPTEKKAIKFNMLQKKVECVEEAARRASKDLAPYILLYCTVRNTSFADLEAKYGIPCSRATFDRHRALFFRHLSALFEENY